MLCEFDSKRLVVLYYKHRAVHSVLSGLHTAACSWGNAGKWVHFLEGERYCPLTIKKCHSSIYWKCCFPNPKFTQAWQSMWFALFIKKNIKFMWLTFGFISPPLSALSNDAVSCQDYIASITNDTDRWKPKYSEEPCPNATSSTTNVTWTALRLNPVLLGEELMSEYFQPWFLV